MVEAAVRRALRGPQGRVVREGAAAVQQHRLGQRHLPDVEVAGRERAREAPLRVRRLLVDEEEHGALRAAAAAERAEQGRVQGLAFAHAVRAKHHVRVGPAGLLAFCGCA